MHLVESTVHSLSVALLDFGVFSEMAWLSVFQKAPHRCLTDPNAHNTAIPLSASVPVRVVTNALRMVTHCSST